MKIFSALFITLSALIVAPQANAQQSKFVWVPEYTKADFTDAKNALHRIKVECDEMKPKINILQEQAKRSRETSDSEFTNGNPAGAEVYRKFANHYLGQAQKIQEDCEKRIKEALSKVDTIRQDLLDQLVVQTLK